MNRAVARQKSLIQQADVQLDVLIMQFRAFTGSANRMAHSQPGVPKHLKKSGDGLFVRGGGFLACHQQQQVYIGIRE